MAKSKLSASVVAAGGATTFPPGKAIRFAAAVVASLFIYVFGAYVIVLYFGGSENGAGMNEWSDSTLRNFWIAFWSYTLAAVPISTLVARRLRAPAIATVVATAAGIGMLWLAYWMVLTT